MRWSKDNSVRINDTDFQTNPEMDKPEAERLKWTKSKVQTQEGCPSEPSRKNSGTESTDTQMRMNDHTCISVTCAAVTPEVSREPPARGLELKQVSSTPNPPAGRVSSSPRTHWAAPAPPGSGSSPLRRPGGRPLRLRQPGGPEAALGPPEPGPALRGGASAPTDPALPAVWGPLPPGRARLHTKSTKPSVATTHSPSSHPRLCLRKRLRATRTLWRHFRRPRVMCPGTPSPGVPRAPCWGRRQERCEPVVGGAGVLGGRAGGRVAWARGFRRPDPRSAGGSAEGHGGGFKRPHGGERRRRPQVLRYPGSRPLGAGPGSRRGLLNVVRGGERPRGGQRSPRPSLCAGVLQTLSVERFSSLRSATFTLCSAFTWTPAGRGLRAPALGLDSETRGALLLPGDRVSLPTAAFGRFS